MCGLLFAKNIDGLDKTKFLDSLALQKWRGPDNIRVETISPSCFAGHVRLAIIDPVERSTQPFYSKDRQHVILFNGEIYNHEQIRQELQLDCRTTSDTETVLEGFLSIGSQIFEMLDGMFSIVIYDKVNSDCWAVRDRYGIKPLFSYSNDKGLVYSSECVSIRHFIECQVDYESVSEWKLIRRPMRGKTFFKEIEDVLPGSVLKNGKVIRMIPLVDNLDSSLTLDFVQDKLKSSINSHEMSDVDNVCLLSGGIDSTLIAAFSSVKEAYTVGTLTNNEFVEAQETADKLGIKLHQITTSPEELKATWKKLINLKGEPLSVPNESLIYIVCNAMTREQKVVLTGEGADELFFGYDRIFRWAVNQDKIELTEFLSRYGYASADMMTNRLKEDLEGLLNENKPQTFIEDFFIHYHLPSLLRRMDFASMAASKEARVPFVSLKLVSYMYRKPPALKIDNEFSKIPLREIIVSLNLSAVINRKKVGFSATLAAHKSKLEEYSDFQKFNLEELGW